MALNSYQQITEQIQNARHILIVTSHIDNGDGVATCLALTSVLKKLNKPADVVITEELKNKLSFLPDADKTKTKINSLKKFIITLDTSKNKINEFSYDTQGDKLNIFITPESGNFDEKNISFNPGEYKYDLIFTINSPDLEHLGSLYEQNTDFFYNTSIINIDNNPANEHYGQINLIDLNAVSSAEIVFNLIKQTNPEFINEDIATNLLASIIIKTRSFKTNSITPKCLNISAELIKLGGNRENIINNLYRNKTLATLNLWGRVLARLKQDTHYKFAWSMISQSDFIKSNATPANLKGVVEELLANAPTIEIALILYETESGQIAAELHTSPNYDALELASPWNPIGTSSQADFYLETNKLLEAESQTIDQIRTRIKPKH